MVEPIEMPFGLRTHVGGPKELVLGFRVSLEPGTRPVPNPATRSAIMFPVSVRPLPTSSIESHSVALGYCECHDLNCQLLSMHSIQQTKRYSMFNYV